MVKKAVKKKDESDVLFGMKSICEYLDGISEATALKFHREFDLPIKKLGGIWQGSKAKINEWSRRQATL